MSGAKSCVVRTPFHGIGVRFDVADAERAHSCSLDRNLTTYDLRLKRKSCTPFISRVGLALAVAHPNPITRSQDEAFACLAQLPHGERSLVTGALNGRISVRILPQKSNADNQFWDRDFQCAVVTWTEQRPITSLAISPSGRRLAVSLESGDVLLYGLSPRCRKTSSLLLIGAQIYHILTSLHKINDLLFQLRRVA